MDRFAQLSWSWQPWVVLCLGLAVFGYARGLYCMGAVRRPRVLGAARIGAFAAGIGVLFAALVSPLDAIAEQLASAHMVQHMLLMLVAPALLVCSRPVVAWLWAFPLPARRAIGRAWMRSSYLYGGFHSLMDPLIVWLLCSVVLWCWHLPGPYDWALSSEPIHAFEHFSFLGTSLMFWTLVIAPYGHRRLGYGMSLLFVAGFSVQMGLLGAILTFATHPLYAAYAHSTAVWGLTPLRDQQLAGLIMWVPVSLFHLCTIAVLFVAWMERADRRKLSATASRVSVVALRCAPSILAISFVLLGGCDRHEPNATWQVLGGHARRGPALITKYGCGSCHRIPGVSEARGTVGPPLTDFGQRIYVAGMLRNTPANLIRWIRAPQSVIPGNAMPDMNVNRQDAADIAAYLFTLR